MKYRDFDSSEINQMDDSRYSYSLNMQEKIEAKQAAINRYHNDLQQMFPGQEKLDKVTESLFTQGLLQLESINQATANRTNANLEAMYEDQQNMNNGDSKTWDCSYNDVDGNHQNLYLGYEKQSVGVNGQEKDVFRYYEMEINPKTQQWDKFYISENEFEEKLSFSNRNKVKEEQGIGRELYSLTAKDGSKFFITDAKDDSRDANSFDDGFTDINMYHQAKDKQITQMTKDDVKNMVQENGITIAEVEAKRTNKPTLGFTKKTAKDLGKTTVKELVKQANGMDTMTSTRA